MYSKVTLVVLLLLTVFLAKGAWGIFMKALSSKNSFKEINKEYMSLEARKQTLSNNIAELNTEEGKEEEIRSKYSVAKDGEVSIVIVDKGATDTNSLGGSRGGFWSNILDWFK